MDASAMNSKDHPPPILPPSDSSEERTIGDILRVVEDLKAGRYESDEPWLTFDLSIERFNQLEKYTLKRDGFVQDKVR